MLIAFINLILGLTPKEIYSGGEFLILRLLSLHMDTELGIKESSMVLNGTLPSPERLFPFINRLTSYGNNFVLGNHTVAIGNYPSLRRTLLLVEEVQSCQ